MAPSTSFSHRGVPWRYIYTLSVVIRVLVYTPFWALYFIPKRNRQRPSWPFARALHVRIGKFALDSMLQRWHQPDMPPRQTRLQGGSAGLGLVSIRSFVAGVTHMFGVSVLGDSRLLALVYLPPFLCFAPSPPVPASSSRTTPGSSYSKVIGASRKGGIGRSSA